MIGEVEVRVTDNNGYKRGRDSKGRFTSGNTGRPKGSTSKATIQARKLLADSSEEIITEAVELALDGDRDMLKFLAGKLIGKMPPPAPVIPLKGSPQEMVHALLKASQKDGYGPDDLVGFKDIMNAYMNAVELDEIMKRLEALESADSRY